MARFLFFSLPLYGHLDWGGMLSSAVELAQRGHEVNWASARPVEAAVAGAGIPFITMVQTGWEALPALPEGLDAATRQALRRERALDAWLDLDRVSLAADELAALCRNLQPDLVVTEPYAAAAALAAEASGARLAVCGRPAVASRPASGSSQAGQRVAALCQRLGVTGRNWQAAVGLIQSDLLHVDFFCRSWYADIADIGPQTRFVGCTHTPEDISRAGEPPVVLITLGTLFNTDPGFFETAAEATFLEGGQPLVVIGDRDRSASAYPGLRLPHGTAVRSWVDFSGTLPAVAAMAHHGGAGTTHAALRHGLPQLAVPHAGDQQVQAGRITQAGVGYGVRPADLSLASARWLLRQLLWNEDLRARARSWQLQLAALGGIPVAANALEAASGPGGFVV